MTVHLSGLKETHDAHNKMHTKLKNLLREKHDKSFFFCFQTLVKDFENVDEIPAEMRFNHLQKFNETEFVNSVTAIIVNKFSLR